LANYVQKFDSCIYARLGLQVNGWRLRETRRRTTKRHLPYGIAQVNAHCMLQLTSDRRGSRRHLKQENVPHALGLKPITHRWRTSR